MDDDRPSALTYACGVCGMSGVRLWREYQTVVSDLTLRCVLCAERHQGKRLPSSERGGGGDTIGWLVPAVPDVLPPEPYETFWGYTSVPDEGVEWWYSLPLLVRGEVTDGR